VKLLLDKNMLENDSYSTFWSINPLNKTVSDVVKILKSQADLQQIQIELQPLE